MVLSKPIPMIAQLIAEFRQINCLLYRGNGAIPIADGGLV
jgi:hypothetical protein